MNANWEKILFSEIFSGIIWQRNLLIFALIVNLETCVIFMNYFFRFYITDIDVSGLALDMKLLQWVTILYRFPTTLIAKVRNTIF